MSRCCAASATTQATRPAGASSSPRCTCRSCSTRRLPFAFLFSALLCLLDLSRKLELVVARASGVSVWGFLRAPFAVAILFGAAATAVLNPLAVDDEGARRQPRSGDPRPHGLGTGHWFRQEGGDGRFDRPCRFRRRRTAASILGVTAFVYDGDGRFREKVEAPRGEYLPGQWVLTDATVISADARAAHGRALRAADVAHRRRNQAAASSSRRRSPSGRCPASSRRRERTGLNPDPFRVALHALMNRPVFFLAMVLIAATVSLRLTPLRRHLAADPDWRHYRLSALCFWQNRQRPRRQRDHRPGAGGVAAAYRRADLRRDRPAFPGGRVKLGVLRSASEVGGQPREGAAGCSWPARRPWRLRLQSAGARFPSRSEPSVCSGRHCRAAAGGPANAAAGRPAHLRFRPRDRHRHRQRADLLRRLRARRRPGHLRQEIRPADRHRRRPHAGAGRQSDHHRKARHHRRLPRRLHRQPEPHHHRPSPTSRRRPRSAATAT